MEAGGNHGNTHPIAAQDVQDGVDAGFIDLTWVVEFNPVKQPSQSICDATRSLDDRLVGYLGMVAGRQESRRIRTERPHANRRSQWFWNAHV